MILTLSELAAQFRFSNPQAFRRDVLALGTLRVRRISRQRWQVSSAELPQRS